MNSNKRKPIRSATYEFDENDVAACQSLDILRDWWDKVTIDIESMERKISQAEENDYKTNKIWLANINTALLIQKSLLKIIEHRFVEMKNKPPQYCYLEMKMIEIIEEKYGMQILQEIKNLALDKIATE